MATVRLTGINARSRLLASTPVAKNVDYAWIRKVFAGMGRLEKEKKLGASFFKRPIAQVSF
jgi:hypothetical protein